MSQANRVETMAQKLVVYARRARVDDVALVAAAYDIAIAPRLDFFPDVFHHDVLHPARNALILIEQAGCRSGVVIAAAELTDTVYPQLRISGEQLCAQVSALAQAVPDPAEDGETLLERLVTAEPDVALIAIAERLDHARHLHMRPPAEWRSFYQEAVTVYLPVAQRVHEQLFRRFQRWASAFARRLP